MQQDQHPVSIKRVTDIYADPPLVHWRGTHTFHVAEQVAQFVHEIARPGMTTLETGCGLSTVVFAMAGCEHTVVTPRSAEVLRVREYLRAKGVDDSLLTARIGPSQSVLPGLKDLELDIVLVDGQHAFPVPFIDWYYSARLLKPGGIMIVDDTQLWTGRVLRRFLADEPGWTQVASFFGRSAAFRKMTDDIDAEWWGVQPFTVRSSRVGQFAEMMRRRTAIVLRRVDGQRNGKAPMSPAARVVTTEDVAVGWDINR